MDHALLVGVLERVGDLLEEPDRLGHRQLALAGEPAAEGFPFDRPDVVDLADGLARIEQRQDVGMLQAGGGRLNRLPLCDLPGTVWTLRAPGARFARPSQASREQAFPRGHSDRPIVIRSGRQDRDRHRRGAGHR